MRSKCLLHSYRTSLWSPPPSGFCAIKGFDLTLISQLLHNLSCSITEFLKLRNRNASVKKPAQRRRASSESFANKPSMLLRCWRKEGEKAKRTHLLRGGGGFLTIDRNLLLNSNRKHLTILKAPQEQQRPLPPGDANREKHNWSALDSEKSLELEETKNQNPNPNSFLTHSILQNPNPNLYFKIWPFPAVQLFFCVYKGFLSLSFCIQFFRQHVNIAFQSWLWRGRLCWWVMLFLDLPLRLLILLFGLGYKVLTIKRKIMLVVMLLLDFSWLFHLMICIQVTLEGLWVT